jgi:WD40 repeat protein
MTALTAASLDHVARLYMSSGELHIALTLHSGPINVLKWNESGSHLITASHDSTVCLWELAAELSNAKNRVLYQSHSRESLRPDLADF